MLYDKYKAEYQRLEGKGYAMEPMIPNKGMFEQVYRAKQEIKKIVSAREIARDDITISKKQAEVVKTYYKKQEQTEYSVFEIRSNEEIKLALDLILSRENERLKAEFPNMSGSERSKWLSQNILGSP